MDTAQNSAATRDKFAFWCGVAGIVATAAFIVSNFALGDFDPPPPAADSAEIAQFFTGEGVKLETAVGLRFVIFVLLAILLYGVARHVQGEDRLAGSLTRLALIGTAWLLAVGTVANTFESILIYQGDGLASEPELSRLASLGMNGLFLAAILPHALIIGTLSLAALRTKTLPTLLIVLGGFQAVTGVLGAVALPHTHTRPLLLLDLRTVLLRLRPLVFRRIHRAYRQITPSASCRTGPHAIAIKNMR